MEPLDYLRLLRRRWVLVALAPVIAVAAMWLVTPAPTEFEPDPLPADQSFTATHIFYKTGELGGVSLDTLALLGGTGVIPQRVVDRLSLDVPAPVLASEVSVTADPKLGTLTISSTNRDGERASLLATTFAEEILAYLSEQIESNRVASFEQAASRLENQQARIRDLDAQIAALPIGSIDRVLLTAERDALINQFSATIAQYQQLSVADPSSVGLTTLQEAVPVPIITSEPVFTPPSDRSGRLLIAALVGMALGLGLALAADRFDTKVRTRKGAKHAYGLPVVAEVPKLPRRFRSGLPITALRPGSAAAESYRALRLSVQLMPRWLVGNRTDEGVPDKDGEPHTLHSHPRADHDTRTVLVTSATAKEGKTTTAANLAASFAEAGRTVLLIDADVRHPQMHRLFEAGASPGLSDFLTKDGPDELAAAVWPTGSPGVYLVPGGAPVHNPAALCLDETLLDAARELADMVIIDSGPLLPVRGPSTLLPVVDAVVVVARAGRTTGEAARRTTEILAQVQAPVLGVALVALPRREFGRARYGSGRRPRSRRPQPDPAGHETAG